MRKIWLLVLAVAVLLGITSGSGACLNAQDVLVVYNTRPSIIPVSRAVADYYDLRSKKCTRCSSCCDS